MHTIFKEHLKKTPGKVSPESQSEWVDNIGIIRYEVKFFRPLENFFYDFPGWA
jgi:hypothetical protein